MGKHMYQNLKGHFFKDMFTDYDEDEPSKMKTGLYEILQMYIQLYQNLEIRVNDMVN